MHTEISKPLDSPSDTANALAMTANDTHVDSPKVTTLLENQVQDLKAQLEKAEQRENTVLPSEIRATP